MLATKMANTLFFDDENGNGLVAVNTTATSSNSIILTTNSNINHSINNIQPNNIIGTTTKIQSYNNNSTDLTASLSNEDLSQSLSEYTDADESMSAPTEFLAEFLSAVMIKDYETALEYCELILQYEPDNATAKEFYPLIKQKIQDGDFSTDGEDLISDEEISPRIVPRDAPLDNDEDNDDSESNNSEESNEGNNSDNNTTHSYSSFLLEDEEDENEDDVDVLPISKSVSNAKEHIIPQDLDVSNGNVKPSTFSDSESPSEPLTQRLAAMFRSKYSPGGK